MIIDHSHAKKRDISTYISDFFMYLVAACLILDLGCMWKIVEGSPIFNLPTGITSGILCLIQVFTVSKIKISGRRLIRLIGILLFFFIYITATRYETGKFLKGYVGVFLCYYIYSTYLYSSRKMGRFLHCFSNIVLIISALSLFFWIFGSIMNILPGRVKTTYYWADDKLTTYTYFHLYYENPIQNIGQKVVRNLGVFSEAPGFSSFILYALLIEVGYKNTDIHNGKNLKRIILLAIVLLSTFSTKAIIALLFIVFLDYISKKNKRPIDICLKVLLGIAILSGGFIITRTLLLDKLTTGSGMMRVDDVQAELKAWLNHPIFGNGFENDESILQYMKVQRSNNGLSMGLTVIMAYGGITSLFFYLYAILISYRSVFFQKNKRVWLITCALLLFNLIISNSGYTDIYILLLSAAYAIPEYKKQGIKRISAQLNI